MSTITISLPAALSKKVDSETKKQGFATSTEYIIAFLMKSLSINQTKKNEFKFEPFVPRPLEEIRADFEKTGKYNKKFIDSVIKGLGKSSFYKQSLKTKLSSELSNSVYEH